MSLLNTRPVGCKPYLLAIGSIPRRKRWKHVAFQDRSVETKRFPSNEPTVPASRCLGSGRRWRSRPSHRSLEGGRIILLPTVQRTDRRTLSSRAVTPLLALVEKTLCATGRNPSYSTAPSHRSPVSKVTIRLEGGFTAPRRSTHPREGGTVAIHPYGPFGARTLDGNRSPTKNRAESASVRRPVSLSLNLDALFVRSAPFTGRGRIPTARRPGSHTSHERSPQRTAHVNSDHGLTNTCASSEVNHGELVGDLYRLRLDVPARPAGAGR